MANVNPFPHIDAFWRLCSRRLFENIVTNEEIAQNEQFLPITVFYFSVNGIILCLPTIQVSQLSELALSLMTSALFSF